MQWSSLGSLVLNTESGDRPPGLHVSTIINDILETLDPKVYGKPLYLPKIGCGVAFEQAAAVSMPHVFRPAPIWVHGPEHGLPWPDSGIWCSPDGLNPLFGCRPVETKCTWYSMAKEFPTDPVYWGWVVQVKAYCHAVGTLDAEVWIQYINGNYKPPQPQPPVGYLVEFTQLEIEENWTMLVNWAKSKGWL